VYFCVICEKNKKLTKGETIVGEMEVFDYGKFGWIPDPEGNKIELWEPVDKEFDKMGTVFNSSS
jgi:predicted enzyme related to lactoylglutathione lyase